MRSIDPNKRKYDYSLVIPAYKEEKRLHNMLPNAIRVYSKIDDIKLVLPKNEIQL